MIFVTIAFGITVYILQGIGLFTLAERRGISLPGLAWVPVGNQRRSPFVLCHWILGFLYNPNVATDVMVFLYVFWPAVGLGWIISLYTAFQVLSA